MAAGAVPAGLGARDTLRLEAGLPLHGHELGPGITPLQAGLGWVVAWDKPGGFRGRDALLAQRGKPPGAGAPGAGRGRVASPCGPATRSSTTETALGELTSGNFSPVLGCGIGMAFLPPTSPPATSSRWRPGAGAWRAGWHACRSSRRRPAGPEPWRTTYPTPTRTSPACSATSACPAPTSSSPASRPRSAWRAAWTSRPGCPKPDVAAELARLAGANRTGPELVCFAGGGAYDHDVPAVDPGAGGKVGVRHVLHPLPARGRPGGPPGPVRVPDPGVQVGGPARCQRVGVRRSDRHRGGGQPGPGRHRPQHRVGERGPEPPLAPGPGHPDGGPGHRDRRRASGGRRDRLGGGGGRSGRGGADAPGLPVPWSVLSPNYLGCIDPAPPGARSADRTGALAGGRLRPRGGGAAAHAGRGRGGRGRGRGPTVGRPVGLRRPLSRDVGRSQPRTSGACRAAWWAGPSTARAARPT